MATALACTADRQLGHVQSWRFCAQTVSPKVMAANHFDSALGARNTDARACQAHTFRDGRLPALTVVL